MNEYDAMIKAKRDEILARLPPIRRFRKLRAKFTSNPDALWYGFDVRDLI